MSDFKLKDINTKRYEKFLRSPKKENYNFLPVRVGLYLTRACNLACPNCTYNDNEYFRKATYLSIEEFQNIIDATKDYAISYALAGGEPLLNKNVLNFAKMVGEQVPTATVTINSNGLLLHRFMDDICESNVGRIQISFDAMDDSGFQRERGGRPGEFEQLCNNVKALLKVRDGRKYPSIAVSFLMHKGNFHELPKMISFAEDLGVDQVGFHNVNNHMDESMEPLRRDDKEVTDLLDAVMKKKYRLGVLLPPLLDDSFNICLSPFKDIFINDTMEICPCCHVMDYSYSKFNGDLETSWKNERLDQFRFAFMENRLPHANCKNCHRRFNFYGSYDIATGWLKDNWTTNQLRKIVRASPKIYRVANKVRNYMNAKLKESVKK